MIQDFFRGQAGPAAAVGFVGLLSILNMAGRFLWATASDYLGRKTHVPHLPSSLGPVPLLLPPPHQLAPRQLHPALRADGRRHHLHVRRRLCDHARLPQRSVRRPSTSPPSTAVLLTAWSTAGIVGPLIVNGILDHYVARHMTSRAGLPHHPPHHDRRAAGRLRRQPAAPTRRPEATGCPTDEGTARRPQFANEPLAREPSHESGATILAGTPRSHLAGRQSSPRSGASATQCGTR